MEQRSNNGGLSSTTMRLEVNQKYEVLICPLLGDCFSNSITYSLTWVHALFSGFYNRTKIDAIDTYFGTFKLYHLIYLVRYREATELFFTSSCLDSRVCKEAQKKKSHVVLTSHELIQSLHKYLTLSLDNPTQGSQERGKEFETE